MTAINRYKKLLERQIENSMKLNEKELKRIIKYTNGDIFGEDCVIWKGYITQNKSCYVNFFYRGRKVALHRILYLNFIGELEDNTYLKYICDNSGMCCNVNHIVVKNTYSSPTIKRKNSDDFSNLVINFNI